MKILFDHPYPFQLTHGGFQIQIEQTKAALENLGVSVEFLRWWDDRQEGDLIHYFGRPSPLYIWLAHEKRRRVVISELLGGLGARPASRRAVQRMIIGVARKIMPGDFTSRMAWDAFKLADACIALTAWEARLMQEMFSAPKHRVHIVPNGVEPVFFEAAPTSRGPWLICTATLNAQKRLLEVAEAAIVAKTPVWFVGKPYNEHDPYTQRFLETARKNPAIIRYDGPIGDRGKMAQAYREARGFVLLSKWESLSLSALEAAACGCPLLLGDLPWAHSVFGDSVSYCRIDGSTQQTAQALRHFYDQAPALPPPPRPASWRDVAQQLGDIYRAELNTSW